MHRRVRTAIEIILYILGGVLLALGLFWIKSVFWPPEYREFRLNNVWVLLIVVLVVLGAISSQEWRKRNSDDNGE